MSVLTALTALYNLSMPNKILKFLHSLYNNPVRHKRCTLALIYYAKDYIVLLVVAPGGLC